MTAFLTFEGLSSVVDFGNAPQHVMHPLLLKQSDKKPTQGSCFEMRALPLPQCADAAL